MPLFCKLILVCGFRNKHKASKIVAAFVARILFLLNSYRKHITTLRRCSTAFSLVTGSHFHDRDVSCSIRQKTGDFFFRLRLDDIPRARFFLQPFHYWKTRRQAQSSARNPRFPCIEPKHCGVPKRYILFSGPKGTRTIFVLVNQIVPIIIVRFLVVFSLHWRC